MKRTCPMLLVLSFLIVIDARQPTSEERNAVQSSLSNANISGSVQRWPVKQRFRRNDNCPDFLTSSCQKCKPGTYLLSCSCNCEQCKDGEFTDAENLLDKCKRCTQCQEHDGKKMKTNCTTTHDTICTCLENFFSLTDEHQCYKCAQCDAETEEVEQPCTETQNTVCRKKGGQSVPVAAVVIPITLVLVVIVAIILCKKKKLPRCKKVSGGKPSKWINGKEQTKPPQVPGTVCNPLVCTESFLIVWLLGYILYSILNDHAEMCRPVMGHCESYWKLIIFSHYVVTVMLHLVGFVGPFTSGLIKLSDIELTEEHLQLMAMEIEPRMYHELGISLGHSEPKVQQIRADYHDDIKQQGYQILYSWFQAHGKKGAFPALINTFWRMGYVTTAENIMEKIIPKDEATVDANTLDGNENGRMTSSMF
ncbi:tumor necrosis factor receptor superfamily member 6-like [Stegostoma tigrinum]|uniref:tumor necrosis factor receptor superfamily member 6-like n=1 Tax=Stegostoma tigrinum TaxID=3053191 RepID=UPI0028708004|nr:tumor necrosis factor receptor superfamily member 6-like [Stegostoma tigrinum]